MFRLFLVLVLSLLSSFPVLVLEEPQVVHFHQVVSPDSLEVPPSWVLAVFLSSALLVQASQALASL